MKQRGEQRARRDREMLTVADSSIRFLSQARQQRGLATTTQHTPSWPTGPPRGPRIFAAGAAGRRGAGDLLGQPLFEHRPREPQVTPDTQTRQLPQAASRRAPTTPARSTTPPQPRNPTTAPTTTRPQLRLPPCRSTGFCFCLRPSSTLLHAAPWLRIRPLKRGVLHRRASRANAPHANESTAREPATASQPLISNLAIKSPRL